MEDLQDLKRELWLNQRELELLRINKPEHDYQGDTVSRNTYSDPKRAEALLNDIDRLQKQIAGVSEKNPVHYPGSEYAARPLVNGDRKYKFHRDGQIETTRDHGEAARYNAQHRFFQMSKFKQSVAKMNGQWGKFERLWQQTIVGKTQEKEQAAQQLDRMFK